MSISVEHDSSRLFCMLERSTTLIARHPDYPGKREALGGCRDDIEQRFRQGMLTEDQRDRLLAILGDATAPD